MAGDARSRFCRDCAKPVHDLSAGTEGEARALLALLGSRGLCVRYTSDRAGAIAFRPAAVLLAALGVGAGAGCSTQPPRAATSSAHTSASTSSAGAESATPHAPLIVARHAADEDSDGDGFEDGDGCPDPDNDHDTIADAVDRCTNDPETFNGLDDTDGCPDRSMGVVVSLGDVQILESLTYERNRSDPSAGSRSALAEIARVLQGHPEVTQVDVIGHASGDERGPQALSERRAQRVVAWLVAQGVDASRLRAQGHGESHPIAPATTAEGRAHNRRVEFSAADSSTTCPPGSTPSAAP